MLCRQELVNRWFSTVDEAILENKSGYLSSAQVDIKTRKERRSRKGREIRLGQGAVRDMTARDRQTSDQSVNESVPNG